MLEDVFYSLGGFLLGVLDRGSPLTFRKPVQPVLEVVGVSLLVADVFA